LARKIFLERITKINGDDYIPNNFNFSKYLSLRIEKLASDFVVIGPGLWFTMFIISGGIYLIWSIIKFSYLEIYFLVITLASSSWIIVFLTLIINNYITNIALERYQKKLDEDENDSLLHKKDSCIKKFFVGIFNFYNLFKLLEFMFAIGFSNLITLHTIDYYKNVNLYSNIVNFFGLIIISSHVMFHITIRSALSESHENVIAAMGDKQFEKDHHNIN